MVRGIIKLAVRLKELLTKGRKKSIDRRAWISCFSFVFTRQRERAGLNSAHFDDQIVAATIGPGQSEPSFDGSPSARVLTNSS